MAVLINQSIYQLIYLCFKPLVTMTMTSDIENSKN